MKYLIVGLGNIGPDYFHTRHNIGFDILDQMAGGDMAFESKRYTYQHALKTKGRTLLLAKPTTYVNRSGLAVRYWVNKNKIPLENVLIVTDDLSLPFGKIRLREKGSAGGHNGLSSIDLELGTQDYPRLRFGIGSDFPRGTQVDYVLSEWHPDEKKDLPSYMEQASEAIKCFATEGIVQAMNKFNS